MTTPRATFGYRANHLESIRKARVLIDSVQREVRGEKLIDKDLNDALNALSRVQARLEHGDGNGRA